MRILFLTLILLLPFFLAAQGVPDTSFVICYKGKADKEYSVTMQLEVNGSYCRGRYFYDKYRQDITFRGQILPNNTVKWTEVDEKGRLTENTFEGTYGADWGSLEGNWKEKKKEKKYSFVLSAIYPTTSRTKERLDFERLRVFQGFLNYFDLQANLPWQISAEMEQTQFEWQKESRTKNQADFNRFIPYVLANRFIMQVVELPTKQQFMDWKITPQDYQPFTKNYRSIGKLLQTNSYVGLLISFQNNPVWNPYNNTFLVMYDYEGHVIDIIPISENTRIDQGELQYEAVQLAAISTDYTIVTQRNTTTERLTKNKAGIEQLETTTTATEIHYILEPDTGRFFRQRISNE